MEGSARVARYFFSPGVTIVAGTGRDSTRQVTRPAQDGVREASRIAHQEDQLSDNKRVESQFRTTRSDVDSLTKNLQGGASHTGNAISWDTVSDEARGSTDQDQRKKKGVEIGDDDDLPSLDDYRRTVDQAATASSAPASFATSWRSVLACNCDENGGNAGASPSFLPPGMLRSAGAVVRMGAGGCYHRSTNR
jgi:hypothetical protein